MGLATLNSVQTSAPRRARFTPIGILMMALCRSGPTISKDSVFRHVARPKKPIRPVERQEVLRISTAALLGLTGAQACLAQSGPNQGHSKCVASAAGRCILSGEVPPKWNDVAPKSRMRLAQWQVDDAECALFLLPIGVGIDAQLRRWQNEFPEEARISPVQIDGVFDPYRGTAGFVVLDVAGSWDGGGPATVKDPDRPLKEGYALRGAVVPANLSDMSQMSQNEQQLAFFIKLIGPQSAVSGNAKAFDAFIDSLRIVDDSFREATASGLYVP